MRAASTLVPVLLVLGLGSAHALERAHPRTPFDGRQTAACGAGGMTATGRQALIRKPYLQKVTAGSAEVLWTATGPSQCAVRLRGPEGELPRFPAVHDRAVKLPRGAQYVVSLQGLKPDTTYCYQVECDDGAWLAETGFRTAPAPGSTGAPIRFIAMGDLGEASAEQRAVAGRLAQTDFDFALVTGDIAYPRGSLDSFERYFFDMYAPLLKNVPFFVASGNHDRNTGPQSAFAQVFSLPENGGPGGKENWYSFEWGPMHIAVLDTERVGALQAGWLDRDLAASGAPWKIVIGHKPPFSAGAHGDNRDVQKWFLPILEKHQIPLALWGHDHNYERLKPVGGVTHIVTGGGGKTLRPVRQMKRAVIADSRAHFMHFELEGDELVAWAVDAEGHELDEVRIRRPQHMAAATVTP